MAMPQSEETPSRDPLQGRPAEVSARDQTSQLIKSEQSLLAKLTTIVRFADFMAVMMVLATAFSAYATWRTAQITRLVFEVSDRPFLGVQQVSFEAVDSSRPVITADIRNFAKIPAVDSIISVKALVDGKPVVSAGELTSRDAGILSPGVPHQFYASVDREQYQAVVQGSSNLMVRVRMLYRGPTRKHSYCYFEKLVYDWRSRSFRPAGGTDVCGSEVF